MTIYGVYVSKKGKPDVDYLYDAAKVLFPFEDGYALFAVTGPHVKRPVQDKPDARVDFCPKGDLVWREGVNPVPSIKERVFAGVLAGKIGPIETPNVPRPAPRLPAAAPAAPKV